MGLTGVLLRTVLAAWTIIATMTQTSIYFLPLLAIVAVSKAKHKTLDSYYRLPEASPLRETLHHKVKEGVTPLFSSLLNLIHEVVNRRSQISTNRVCCQVDSLSATPQVVNIRCEPTNNTLLDPVA